MSSLLKYILLLSVTLVLLFIGYQSYSVEYRSVELTRQISAKNDTSKTIQKKVDKLLEELSVGLYAKYSKNKTKLEALEKKAEQLHRKSILYLYYFFATFALFTLLFYWIDFELLILYIGITALISLIVALFTPLVVMTVYSSLPIVGEVTLSYESKTLFGTIAKLFSHSNYLIASLVLLFSVIIPLLKSFLIIMYGFFKETGFGKKSVKMIEKIGKWSMADVFIVALLVVLFSTKQDIHTSLIVETGLYFFIGYVLLSMVGSSLLTAPKAR